MIEAIIAIVTGLISLGIKLYAERNDKHDEIVAQWQALQASAAALEASLVDKRAARDAASLRRLDELEGKTKDADLSSLALQIAAKLRDA